MKTKYLEINSPGSLRIEGKVMIFQDASTNEKKEIALIDLEVICLGSRQLSVSSSFLVACAEGGIAVIVANNSGIPVGQFLSFGKPARLKDCTKIQIKLTDERRSAFWADIVRAKVCNQKTVLKVLGLNSVKISQLESKINIGDPLNIEAQAAKYYWKELFGSTFKRDRSLPGINAALNYGYAVIRSYLLKRVIAVGLNPQFGVFHCSSRNPFPLVDDLIEPFRAYADYLVKLNEDQIRSEQVLSLSIRKKISEVLLLNLTYNGEKYTITEVLLAYCRNCRDIISSKDYIPFVSPGFDEVRPKIESEFIIDRLKECSYVDNHLF